MSPVYVVTSFAEEGDLSYLDVTWIGISEGVDSYLGNDSLDYSLLEDFNLDMFAAFLENTGIHMSKHALLVIFGILEGFDPYSECQSYALRNDHLTLHHGFG